MFEEKNTCKTCGHYQLYLMITSNKPYGYSGNIPCFGCIRYETRKDYHTNLHTKYQSNGFNEALALSQADLVRKLEGVKEIILDTFVKEKLWNATQDLIAQELSEALTAHFTK